MCRGNRKYINNGVFECFVSRVWISVLRELTEDLCLVDISQYFHYPFHPITPSFPQKKEQLLHSHLSFLSRLFQRTPIPEIVFSMRSPSLHSFSVTQYLSQIPDSSATSVVVVECGSRLMQVWSALCRKSN